MRFLSFISDHPDSAYATDYLVGEIALRLRGQPDVVFVFFTGDHLANASKIAGRLFEQLEPGCLLGTSAEGVIGFDREIERAPGIAILAGQLPGVRVRPFRIEQAEWPEMITQPSALAERVGREEHPRALVAFGDPFSTPLTQLMAKMDEALPGIPLIGGMASTARRPGGNMLIHNDRTYDDGLVGVGLSGAVDVQTIVSQGCRPIGRTFVITRAHENVIDQLGGRPPLEALRSVVEDLDEQDQELLGKGLFIGRAISEYREQFTRGDFLVRNVIGIDENTGVLAITEPARVGQTVQFHVRDAATASEDLSLMLASQRDSTPAAGGLLFSCNGRGSRMFQKECHDITQSRLAMPQTPVAGFFAAGELGPVGGRNFVHGHTASFALFRPKNEEEKE